MAYGPRSALGEGSWSWTPLLCIRCVVAEVRQQIGEHVDLFCGQSRAQSAVEGDHRQTAWRVMGEHVTTARYPQVIEAMERALQLWLGYRDAVAEACGLVR